MVQFSADQNQFAFKYESGAYGTTSGTDQWIGLVQTNAIDENENIIPIRYAGGTRNVSKFVQGARDVTGTLTYYPQDLKFGVFALGAGSTTGSPNYVHTITETDGNDVSAYTGGNFPSFTIFDGKDILVDGSGLNFNRTINGCMVDSFTLSSSEGEPITAEVGWVGQEIAFSSGAGPAPTAATTVPYMWSNAIWALPSGTASVLDKVKNWSISINNNQDIPHYSNGSRAIGQPKPTMRDYEVSLTVNMDSSNSKALYTQYFLGGSTFNLQCVITRGANDNIEWTFSGCSMIDMEVPSVSEGIQEQTLTIKPATSSIEVNDQISKYNIW